MNKVRYIDRNILCMYDFQEEFFELLGLKIYDIVPLRRVFVLFTDKGKKILKLIDSEVDRVNFINKSLKYIEGNFKNVLRYYENINGEIVTEWNNKKYVVLNLLDGRECAFTNPIEVDLCSQALAKMHIAANNFISTLDEEELNYNLGENLIDKMINQKKDILEIEALVKRFKYKNNFDNLFLDNVSLVKKELDRSITLLNSSEYEELIKNKSKFVLCHNDLAHHNFIIDNDIVNIIDFDYCKLDIKIIDIYNYVIKVIKNLGYSKEVMDKIVKEYKKINYISKEEINILKALINYPKDFINISILYYFKEKDWEDEAFISKLKNKIEIDEFRRELIISIKNK